MDARVGNSRRPGPRGGMASKAAAACLALCLASWPAAAVDEPWRDDFEIDMALGTLDDPSLIQVLTQDPVPENRIGPDQPFNQQAPAAQDDFDQPADQADQNRGKGNPGPM